MHLQERARAHAALGDSRRLGIVDALWLGDLTPSQLAAHTGLSSNLLAHHLGVLEEAGLVRRHSSQGDGRRRYVSLLSRALPTQPRPDDLPDGPVLFVCTHNAVRSQFAGALWRQRGGEATSAGTDPADHVHPLATAVAADHDLDLGGARPRSYAEVDAEPALVIAVCDRAREAPLPFRAPLLHWSVPDPIDGDRSDVDRTFAEVERRVDRLAREVAA